MKARINVTFETITDESAQDGDFADHGWIRPDTAERRSLRKGGKRMCERNVRMAQRGRFDFPSLREALETLEREAGGPACEAHPRDWRDGKPRGISVRYLQDGPDVCMGRHGYYESDERENLELHVSCSPGSAKRIARLLGVRLYQ